ncbi:MAG TPA: right-handed parallel beta-helix repeat-containing protein [Acidimicrobiales bacterium]
MTTARRRLGLALASVLVVAAACGGDDDDGTDAGDGNGGDAAGATIDVPDDHPTIQEAVDAAEPGDLILVAPGVYEEAVDVETDELTIRGLDRNEVVLDGGFELDNGIRVAGADGVAVENMTARNYTRNGFFWTEAEGYRGSYLTTYRTGDYGVYAFDSTKGLIEHSYASGSPDAGFYIGQCYPCDAVIDQVVSEYNGLGYSGTNSGGNLLIVNSTFRNNRAGIVPNSGSYELCYPERETTIVGNVVHGNNQPDTPAIEDALLAMGNGILVAGGVGNTIERNLVYDHDRTGIGVVPYLEDDPNDDIPPPEDDDRPCAETLDESPADPASIPEPLIWDPRDNRVVGNLVEDSRLADLAVGALAEASGLGNCFAENTFATSAPEDLEALAPCEGEGSGDWSVGALDLAALIAAEHPPSGDYKTTPVPEPQENMPDAATAPARPATGMPPAVDLDAIEVPSKPS